LRLSLKSRKKNKGFIRFENKNIFCLFVDISKSKDFFYKSGEDS